jgi:signal transduction histidine kinase
VEGVEEWLELVDQALQGLHHALNNRIGSLSALVELFQLGDLTHDGSGFESLAADLTRLGDCNRMVRLLSRDSMAGEEPLILDDVLADVFAIHRFLHEVRDVQVSIVPTRYVEPVRVERWALIRVLTLLLADAKRLAKDSASVVRAVTASDEQWVCVEFRVGSPLVAAAPTSAGGGRYSEGLAVRFGATVTRKPGVAELRMPTLKARRALDRQ